MPEPKKITRNTPMGNSAIAFALGVFFFIFLFPSVWTNLFYNTSMNLGLQHIKVKNY